MKIILKSLLSTTIIALSFGLSACGGGSSAPATGPTINATIANDHLSVPNSVSHTHHLQDANPTVTSLNFTASNLSKDITITVTDAKTSGNSLLLNNSDSGTATCTLSAGKANTNCTISVGSVATDSYLSGKNTDTISFAASDGAATFTPSNAITITFTKGASSEAYINAVPGTNQLSIPSSSKQINHNLKISPVSTNLTFTGFNLTKPVTVSVKDDKTEGTLLLDGKSDTDTCTIKPDPGGKKPPYCFITVATTPSDEVGKQDQLSFTAADGTKINPPAQVFQFNSKVSSTPTITISPSTININQHGATSFAIQGSGFTSTQTSRLSYTLTTTSGTNPIATINDGHHSTAGYCDLSIDNNYLCNVQLEGENIGTATLSSSITTGTHATVNDPSVDINVTTKPPIALTYTFDATKVGGTSTAATSVAHITSIGHVTHDGQAYFNITTDGHLQIKSGTPNGVYQINIKATDAHGNAAYNTFYVLVNSNLSYSNWLSGKMAAYNVNTIGGQPLTMLYSYSHFAPYTEKPSDEQKNFLENYTQYGNDVKTFNTKYLSAKAPITVLTAEFGGPAYQPLPIGSDKAAPSYWTVDSAVNDIKGQVTSSASIMNNGFTNLDWIPQWMQVSGVIASNPTYTVSPDLTFGNYVRADYTTYDPEQMDTLVNTMMKYVLDPKTSAAYAGLSGINLDLEKGTSNTNAAAFKTFADNLAYHGLFFGYYEFADKSFQPSIINAMGPLGIAFVSAYDVGTTRDTLKNYNDTVSGLGDFLYNDIYSNNVSCGSPGSDGEPYGRDSWCNLSTNDSLYSNTQAWTSINTPSTKDAIAQFNGNFSVTLPIGESSTDFTYLELIHPDFAALTASQAGLVVTNDAKDSACGVLAQNHDASNYNDANISACLLQAKTFSYKGKNYTFGQYKPCLNKDGSALSYKDCILISANLSGTTDTAGMIGDDTTPAGTAVGYPSQGDYIRANLKAYSQINPNLVGYSLFALQDAASGPGGTYAIDRAANPKKNDAIQEPWTIGGLTTAENCIYQNGEKTADCDPFYYSQQSGLDPLALIDHAWTEFAKLDLPRK